MTSEMERLDKYRSQVRTKSGPASYVDTGGPGRPVLFVHGVGTSSYLWRNVIGQLEGERRCVAFDLPLHGYTPATPDQDFTLPGLARFIQDCCEALELTDFDMVANDTGGAITQVFAAGHPERLHTLTLTNCEAHDNVPPRALLPAVLPAPNTAAAGYGVPATAGSDGAYLAVKGVRDLSLGIVGLALLAFVGARAETWFMLGAALIPLGDMLIVLRHGGTQGVAFGLH